MAILSEVLPKVSPILLKISPRAMAFYRTHLGSMFKDLVAEGYSELSDFPIILS
jgi:hypothetical protein